MHPQEIRKIINTNNSNKSPFERLVITCADKNNKNLK